MINLTINGIKVTVPEDTTIMEAAKSIGVHIPNLCYLSNVHQFGSCRICVVEVEGAKNASGVVPCQGGRRHGRAHEYQEGARCAACTV